jgi:hypothetical protein
MEIVREQRALEEAIEEVEAEYAADEAHEPEPPSLQEERPAPDRPHPPFFVLGSADPEDNEAEGHEDETWSDHFPLQREEPEPEQRQPIVRPPAPGKAMVPERSPVRVEQRHCFRHGAGCVVLERGKPQHAWAGSGSVTVSDIRGDELRMDTGSGSIT